MKRTGWKRAKVRKEFVRLVFETKTTVYRRATPQIDHVLTHGPIKETPFWLCLLNVTLKIKIQNRTSQVVLYTLDSSSTSNLEWKQICLCRLGTPLHFALVDFAQKHMEDRSWHIRDSSYQTAKFIVALTFVFAVDVLQVHRDIHLLDDGNRHFVMFAVMLF